MIARFRISSLVLLNSAQILGLLGRSHTFVRYANEFAERLGRRDNFLLHFSTFGNTRIPVLLQCRFVCECYDTRTS